MSTITSAVLFLSSLTGTTLAPSGSVPMKVRASAGLPSRVRSSPSLTLNFQKFKAECAREPKRCCGLVNDRDDVHRARTTHGSR